MTDTDKSKAPRSSRGVDNPIIPSTQIREALPEILTALAYKSQQGIEKTYKLPSNYLNNALEEASDAILNLFKAELNQLLEEMPEKISTEFSKYHHQTQVDGFNEALDLAKQVIVKRIKELE